MTILFFLIISYILLSLSLYTLFPKMGLTAQKALIPGLNFMLWCEAIGRPRWWAALLLIPIVQIFIYAGICVDLVRSFGKYKFRDSALSVIYAPISFFLIGRDKKSRYTGPALLKERAYFARLVEAEQKGQAQKLQRLKSKNPYRKSPLREWTEAVVFAVFAAAFIRLFAIEAFAIPTSSMEGSLLVGDHLFVSKLHYGLRTPQTVAMIPLLHNRIPLLNKESYLEKPNLPFSKVEKINSTIYDDLLPSGVVAQSLT